MNKKQAIKSRQATKASENVQQEIHAADILKGNKVTVENTPAAVRAHKLNSLVSRILSISCPFLSVWRCLKPVPVASAPNACPSAHYID